MTINDVADAAMQLTAEQKLLLLARLSHELTIAARDTYVPGAEDIVAPRQIRAYNEMQHRVSACLCELIERRTTDLWIWPYISESSEMAGCGMGATRACVSAIQSVQRSEG
jgi:hypothetical protein